MLQLKYKIICFMLLMIPSISLAQPNRELVVFGASSLTNALTEISELYEQIYDVEVTLNFAGSSTLTAQLQQGAPADIFASANVEQLYTVIDENLIDEAQARIFAENELAIIVPYDNPADIHSAEDLAQRGLFLAIASPTVPIRVYTDALLETLALIYDENFIADVLQNVVSEESNVRQIVARVALGEVDAGIVYRTDMTPDIADDVRMIPLPLATSPRAQYPIAPLIDAPNPDEAQAFIAFVLSDTGQAILQSWGFCSPESYALVVSPADTITPTPDLTPTAEVTPDAQAPC